MTRSHPSATWVRTAVTELRLALQDVAALLLPGSCAACGAPADGGLCADCLALTGPPVGPACPRCGSAWESGGGGCPRCRRFGRPFAFEGAAGLLRYHGPVRSLVHAFKYERRHDLLTTWGRRMADSPRLGAQVAALRRPLVVPVTARSEGVAERGYDQAALLAGAFAARAGLEHDARALRRRRHVPSQQAGRAADVRRRQMRGAFAGRSWRVHGRDVLLVDDVLSTAATVDAAARALRVAGAGPVRVLALAT